MPEKKLGAVISQEGHPISFYSRKLNSAQLDYTIGERELQAIIENLKPFGNIILGQETKVWNDHHSIINKTVNIKIVMKWKMIAEKYGTEIH